ncbi:MAG: hypothetical protein JAY88_12370 [Candidatus Thiodiazotropha lotti]|nr:hypothetical protein [Candidatus Thiodiazotropha lotti]MCW4187859.1 hypothetical protein [Candidatus Thiodiazotropha lotti]
MGYCLQLKQFDPKEGHVPSHPFPLLPEIASRARAQLSVRTIQEIQSAAELIDWILEDDLERETDKFIQDQIDNQGWAKDHLQEAIDSGEDMRFFVNYYLYGITESEPEHICPSNNNQNEVTTLKKCIDSFCLDFLHYQDGKDYECFSVLALWMLADCLESTENNDHTTANNYALKAMDAITYAEHLHDIRGYQDHIFFMAKRFKSMETELDNEVEKIVSKRRSESARRGALKRHEEHAALRKEALEHYESHKHEYSSNEDAARKIAGVIVPVTHRTVVNWISKYQKSQSAS